MYYVVYGYSGPDHYTSDDKAPLLRVKEFKNPIDVEQFYIKWMRDCGDPDVSNQATFRVFHGVERKVVPVTKVTEYVLE